MTEIDHQSKQDRLENFGETTVQRSIKSSERITTTKPLLEEQNKETCKHCYIKPFSLYLGSHTVD